MKTWLFVFATLILLSLSFVAEGQTADSSLYDEALNNAISVHESQLKDQLPILNGSVFVEYPYTFISGSPFFSVGHFQPGSVIYDNTSYENIFLVYDDLAGDLIAKLTLNVRLVPEKITSFSILEHHFVPLPATLMPSDTGFYERMATGRVNLYRKARKKLDVKRARLGEDVYAMVVESTSYLLEQDGRIYPVNSKSELISRLKDKSEAVKQFIRTNRLTMETGNYEYGLLKVIAYYNGTNP